MSGGFVIRSYDSNGSTIIRAHSAQADDTLKTVDVSTGNLCTRLVRYPGKTEDRPP